jgi:hypothetical protein
VSAKPKRTTRDKGEEKTLSPVASKEVLELFKSNDLPIKEVLGFYLGELIFTQEIICRAGTFLNMISCRCSSLSMHSSRS